MSVNGIGTTGYPAWQGARKTQQNTAGKNFAEQVNNAAVKKGYTVYLKTDDMLYSGGNGTGLSFYIKYAEGSTEDDPIVTAKGVDENGKEFEQTIHINRINPRNASLVEMTALESYMGVDKNGGLTSLPPETGMMGLSDRTNFMDIQKSGSVEMDPGHSSLSGQFLSGKSERDEGSNLWLKRF